MKKYWNFVTTAASLDQFKSYAHRENEFKNVNNLSLINIYKCIIITPNLMVR